MSARCLTFLALLSATAAVRLNMDMATWAMTGSAATGASSVSCSSFTICSTCLNDPACIWCGDNGGSCIEGTSDGPKNAGQCKVWEASACAGEPCRQYSGCHTCLADPFCGWCQELKACTEGDTAGPLSGTCPGWRFEKCPAALPSANDTSADTLEGKAAKRVGELDSAAKQIGDAAGNSTGASSEAGQKQKKAFNLLKNLKKVLAQWKARKAAEEAEAAKDRELFAAKVKTLQAKRKGTFDRLKKVIAEEFSEEIAEEKALAAKAAEDAKLEAEMNATDDGVNAPGAPGSVNGTDNPMANLANWLKTASAKDLSLLRSLRAAGVRKVEMELRHASERKMARHEASWYACTFLLQNPAKACADFHERYNGIERIRQLTPEEGVRVCNEAKGILDQSTSKPAPPETPGAQRDLYLQWCVNNVRL